MECWPIYCILLILLHILIKDEGVETKIFEAYIFMYILAELSYETFSTSSLMIHKPV